MLRLFAYVRCNQWLYLIAGVYSDPDCNSKELNQDVLVVGYGSENGKCTFSSPEPFVAALFEHLSRVRESCHTGEIIIWVFLSRRWVRPGAYYVPPQLSCGPLGGS